MHLGSANRGVCHIVPAPRLCLSLLMLTPAAISPSSFAVPEPVQARYSIIDLGTLGGSDSFAFGINNRGEIVGMADLKLYSSHAFLWKQGRMHDLGSLPSYAYSEAYAINDKDEIVGNATAGGREPGPTRAVIWEHGKIRELPLPSTSGLDVAYAINNR